MLTTEILSTILVGVDADQTFYGRENRGLVVRVGNTIRRPTGPWTPTVHAFLRHLRDRGFEACPDALGVDEMGREVLTFIPGQVVQDPAWDGGPTLWPAKVRDDETLATVGLTLRRLHDAAAGFRPEEERPWRQWTHPLGPDEIVCHGDLGHWNTVHRPDGTIAFIDWDAIRPDRAELEFGTAAWNFVPLADEDFLRGTGWEDPPDVAVRLRTFCDAYGIGGAERVLGLLHRSKERWPEHFQWWPIAPTESAALLRHTAAELEWLGRTSPRLQRALG